MLFCEKSGLYCRQRQYVFLLLRPSRTGVCCLLVKQNRHGHMVRELVYHRFSTLTLCVHVALRENGSSRQREQRQRVPPHPCIPSCLQHPLVGTTWKICESTCLSWFNRRRSSCLDRRHRFCPNSTLTLSR